MRNLDTSKALPGNKIASSVLLDRLYEYNSQLFSEFDFRAVRQCIESLLLGWIASDHAIEATQKRTDIYQFNRRLLDFLHCSEVFYTAKTRSESDAVLPHPLISEGYIKNVDVFYLDSFMEFCSTIQPRQAIKYFRAIQYAWLHMEYADDCTTRCETIFYHKEIASYLKRIYKLYAHSCTATALA